jgi:hypothetical protein
MTLDEHESAFTAARRCQGIADDVELTATLEQRDHGRRVTGAEQSGKQRSVLQGRRRQRLSS